MGCFPNRRGSVCEPPRLRCKVAERKKEMSSLLSWAYVFVGGSKREIHKRKSLKLSFLVEDGFYGAYLVWQPGHNTGQQIPRP